MALSIYRKKRDFSKSREPRGSSQRKSGAHPIFVVQRHRARALHYDFRLEARGVLKSWAVPKGPPLRADDKRLAVMTEDHPLEYARFHGTIPKGEYGAGTVEIWDRGTYKLVSPQSGFRRGHITVTLRGKKLKGEYALLRFRGPKNWLLIKAKKKP